jgi:hypothetical protein
LERGRCTTRGRSLALRRRRRTEHRRAIVSASQGEWRRVRVQSQRTFICSIGNGLCHTLPHPGEFPSKTSVISFSFSLHQYSPPRASPYHARSPLPFIHGPGQQVQLAPHHGPGSTSHSGLIDPCNLFCKVCSSQHSPVSSA